MDEKFASHFFRLLPPAPQTSPAEQSAALEGCPQNLIKNLDLSSCLLTHLFNQTVLMAKRNDGFGRRSILLVLLYQPEALNRMISFANHIASNSAYAVQLSNPC